MVHSIENAPPAPTPTPAPSHNSNLCRIAKTTVRHENSPAQIYLPTHIRAYMTISQLFKIRLHVAWTLFIIKSTHHKAPSNSSNLDSIKRSYSSHPEASKLDYASAISSASPTIPVCSCTFSIAHSSLTPQITSSALFCSSLLVSKPAAVVDYVMFIEKELGEKGSHRGIVACFIRVIRRRWVWLL